MGKISLNISIVLYKTSSIEVIDLLNTLKDIKHEINHIFFINNSDNEYVNLLPDWTNLHYIKNSNNVGFGKAHNIAIEKTLSGEFKSKYILVLNSDIIFDVSIIRKLYQILIDNPQIGNIMPKVLGYDNEDQGLSKKLPNPLGSFLRLLTQNKRIQRVYCDDKHTYNIPILSGCFMMLNSKCIEKVKKFDERFFLYFEDIDLCRRIYFSNFLNIYYPKLTIMHKHRKSSFKNIYLLIIHIRSAILYFNKWGWFYDKERIIDSRKSIRNRIFNY